MCSRVAPIHTWSQYGKRSLAGVMKENNVATYKNTTLRSLLITHTRSELHAEHGCRITKRKQ